MFINVDYAVYSVASTIFANATSATCSTIVSNTITGDFWNNLFLTGDSNGTWEET